MLQLNPSKWTIWSFINRKGKSTSSPRQTSTSTTSPDLQPRATPSSLAGQAEASSSQVPNDSSIIISILSRASGMPTTQDTHVTQESRFQSLKSRIRHKLFSKSPKEPIPPISPTHIDQENAHSSQVPDPDSPPSEPFPCPSSTTTLVPAHHVEHPACTPRNNDQDIPTSSHDTQPGPSSLTIRTRPKPVLSPIESSPTRARGSWYELPPSGPPTSTTTSTNDSNFGERALWRQWVKSLSSKNSRMQVCDEHKIIATATALYDWDGVIPGRQTRGATLREGQRVHICNVTNDSWLHAHVNDLECVHLPRIFVRIEGFDDERGRQLLGRYLEVPKTPVALRFSFMGEPLPTSAMTSLLSLRHRRTVKGREQGERSQRRLRPEVPPAPFAREPSDKDHQGNRVMVDTKCSYNSSGVVITFTFTLVPALRSRLTSLRFTVKLPGGQKISGIFPEHIIGQKTDVQHTASKSRELALKASASHAGIGIDLGYGESRVHGVEYSRTVKAEIRGAGVNSDVATWTASEDIAARCGLENKMEFSIMLPTRAPPAKVACQYTFGVQKEGVLQTNHWSRGSFEHSWDVSFLQGSTTSEGNHARRQRRPFFS